MLEIILVLGMLLGAASVVIAPIWVIYRYFKNRGDSGIVTVNAVPSKPTIIDDDETSDVKYPRTPDELIEWLSADGVDVNLETRKAIRNLFLEGKLKGIRLEQAKL
jgi:hypothetical protein